MVQSQGIEPPRRLSGMQTVENKLVAHRQIASAGFTSFGAESGNSGHNPAFPPEIHFVSLIVSSTLSSTRNEYCIIWQCHSYTSRKICDRLCLGCYRALNCGSNRQGASMTHVGTQIHRCQRSCGPGPSCPSLSKAPSTRSPSSFISSAAKISQDP